MSQRLAVIFSLAVEETRLCWPRAAPKIKRRKRRGIIEYILAIFVFTARPHCETAVIATAGLSVRHSCVLCIIIIIIIFFNNKLTIATIYSTKHKRHAQN